MFFGGCTGMSASSDLSARPDSAQTAPTAALAGRHDLKQVVSDGHRPVEADDGQHPAGSDQAGQAGKVPLATAGLARGNRTQTSRTGPARRRVS